MALRPLSGDYSLSCDTDSLFLGTKGVKVVFVGDAAVGKSVLLASAVGKKACSEYEMTVAANVTRTSVSVNEKAVALHLFDVVSSL